MTSAIGGLIVDRRALCGCASVESAFGWLKAPGSSRARLERCLGIRGIDGPSSTAVSREHCGGIGEDLTLDPTL